MQKDLEVLGFCHLCVLLLVLMALRWLIGSQVQLKTLICYTVKIHCHMTHLLRLATFQLKITDTSLCFVQVV